MIRRRSFELGRTIEALSPEVFPLVAARGFLTDERGASQ